MDAESPNPSGMKNKQHGKVGNCVSVCAAFKQKKEREIERETQHAAPAAAAENKAISRGAQ